MTRIKHTTHNINCQGHFAARSSSALRNPGLSGSGLRCEARAGEYGQAWIFRESRVCSRKLAQDEWGAAIGKDAADMTAGGAETGFAWLRHFGHGFRIAQRAAR
jgi:hypothetical protein